MAVKKIKIGSRQEASDGINLTALREIKFLQEVKHPNIIEVHSLIVRLAKSFGSLFFYSYLIPLVNMVRIVRAFV